MDIPKVRLNQEVIFRLGHPDNKKIKDKVAEALGRSIISVNKYVRENEYNSDLVKWPAIDIIMHDLWEQMKFDETIGDFEKLENKEAAKKKMLEELAIE